MNIRLFVLGILTCLITVVAGLIGVPLVFKGRVLPLVKIDRVELSGVAYDMLPGVIGEVNKELVGRHVKIVLQNERVSRSLSELGASIAIEETEAEISALSPIDIVKHGFKIRPKIKINSDNLYRQIQSDFSQIIVPPRNATLRLTTNGSLELLKGSSGDGVDLNKLEKDLAQVALFGGGEVMIELKIVSSEPEVKDDETTLANDYAKELLSNGLSLKFEEEEWLIKPFTIQRLMRFVEQVDPNNPNNHILGLAFDGKELREYLENTLVPSVNREAVDARFERAGERVVQFALSQSGRELNLDESVLRIAATLAARGLVSELKVAVAEPVVNSTQDIEELGITSLLAVGQTDFAGSPSNRVHNINVGTERYHGLLISPGEEFSFNRYLGPVDASAGYLPELVIKNNVTTPEYGGGLCQVSTTVFRAALNAGLDITKRRNHAYAVRYYGVPGLDATIYPPYTDLRFTNNTPGYILVQTRVSGTNLIFEFWGTDDGREVKIAGPVTYDLQPDGAVKATVSQTVIRAGETLVDSTFYSNYKSPKLFPKVLAADDPKNAVLKPAGVEPVVEGPKSNDTSTTKATSSPSATPIAPGGVQDKKTSSPTP